MNERIDSDTLDVDFTKIPGFVPGDTTTDADLFGLPDFASMEEVFDDRRIDEEIEKIDAAGGSLDTLGAPIKNQRNEGSCVSNATTAGMEDLFIVQFGRELLIPLSAISLYKRCGRSANSGSTVSGNIAEAKARGVLPLNTPENQAKFKHTMSATGFSQRMPDGWEDTGKLFVILETAVCRSTNAMLTALCKQKPVIVGRNGHSIQYSRPMRRNGRRVVKYKQSYGEETGDNGYQYDSESYFKSAASYAVAILSVRMGT